MRLIVSKDERKQAENAIEILSKVITAFEDGHQYKTDDKETAIIAHFLDTISLSTGTEGELDTVLMSEIGKGFKNQYLAAQDSGDKTKEDRFYGAMFATKQFMDMLKEPEY